MATSAQYAVGPTIDVSQISTANANRDGTGTLVEIAAGPVTTAGNGVGKRIMAITICATGTTTAGAIRIFITPDNGTTKRLLDEFAVPAITASATQPAYSMVVSLFKDLILPGGNGTVANYRLYASTEKAETFNIIVHGATF